MSRNIAANQISGFGQTHLRMAAVAAVLLFGLFVAYAGPLLLESASNNCSSLELLFISKLEQSAGKGTLGNLSALTGSPSPTKEQFGPELRKLQKNSNGKFISSFVAQAYPNLPTELGCTRGYWDLAMMNPETVQAIAVQGFYTGLLGHPP